MSTTVRLEPTQPGADAPETAPLAAAHTQVLSDAQIAAATSRLETQPLAASTPLLLPLERIAVGLLLLVALVTRMYTLSVTELNIDELGQVYAAQLDFRPALRDIATHEGAAPLDYFLTAAMLTVGRDEGTLRMPAAVMGVLTILVLYLLSRSMFGRAEALVIASILTILPLHVRYSQELRFYSLGVLGVVSAAAVFWYAQKRAKWWAWALYGLTLIVFLHAHYYVAFTAAALALWTLFFRRSQLLACWSFSLLALLAFLPWVYYDNVTVQTRGGIDLLIENWSLPAGATAIWTGPFALSLVAPKWNLAGLEFGWGVGWVLRYV
jgi:4-amino-4-deoxy-L-arabinose transferase-like glycosyltransferase